jgi:heme/copper-type cytochrome/quinol oxidase subunit 2
MDTKVLEWMSYLILFSTVLTMIFGLIAYFLYKMRERRPRNRKVNTQINKQTSSENKEIVEKKVTITKKVLEKKESGRLDLNFNLKSNSLK